jgi:hypothetical protein
MKEEKEEEEVVVLAAVVLGVVIFLSSPSELHVQPSINSLTSLP